MVRRSFIIVQKQEKHFIPRSNLMSCCLVCPSLVGGIVSRFLKVCRPFLVYFESANRSE